MPEAVTMPEASGQAGDAGDVARFFDNMYSSSDRYWWQQPERHSQDPNDYPASLLTQQTLRLLADRPSGRALDLGAGEGADAIRLALMGYEVHAVEISKIGADKILAFADQAGTSVSAEAADIREYKPDGTFDVVICNGVLHYIAEKRQVVRTMQHATRRGGLNVISLWSSYTPVPECHKKVPVYCDEEDGIVRRLYQGWPTEFIYLDRAKPESSHCGMPDHAHSHIKMISRKP